MSTPVTGARVMLTLLRREIIEQRLLLVYLPIGLAIASMLFYVVWLADRPESPLFPAELMARVREQVPERNWESFIDYANRTRNAWYSNAIHIWYDTTISVMQVAFWGSMAYYYLTTLYQQRANRSILFWNSMPVTDAQTVASKLLAGLVGCHALYGLCFVLMNAFLFATVGVYYGFFGGEGWKLYLDNSTPWSLAIEHVAKIPSTIAWSLPAYGWLLLASAWARRAPFAWALGPVVAVVLVEVALTQKSWLFNTAVTHLIPMRGFQMVLGTQYQSLELALGALLGMVFVIAAVRFNRSDDT